MNTRAKEQPLTPALSPYEGERENLSPVLEQLDFHVAIARVKNGRTKRGWPCASFAVLVLLTLAGTALAQPGVGPPRDPMMSMMLAQPHIDVESPVVPTAVFDPPTVRVGEKTTYRVQMNALEESVEWPAKLNVPAKLEVHPGARGQMLGMSGPNLQPITGFNYDVRATEPGKFSIPEFTITVYGKQVKVPAAELEVVAAAQAGTAATPLKLSFEAAATNLYSGQAVKVTVRIPATPEGVMLLPVQQPPVQINGDGLLIDHASTRQRPEVRAIQMGLTYETMVTPIASGKVTGFAQAFVGNRFPGMGTIVINGGSGPVTIPGGAPRYTLLDSDPITFQVQPLPKEGQLPGFTGAVGVFTLEPPELSTTSAQVGEPIRLTIKVHGDAASNLGRLVPPPPPQTKEWQILPPNSDSTHPQILQLQGFTSFSYTLVPLTEKVSATPPIPFSYFDPNQKAYVNLTIPAVPLIVNPGSAPVDLKAIAAAVKADPEKEPELSGLAATPGLTASSLTPIQQQGWFPLLQLAPAAAFFGLWSWDRRRRYYEQHPDVLLKRRARRALRRERRALAKAARSGDAPAYAAAAVSAMRVACAPHYPAEPGALVGSDVLPLLEEDERAGSAGEAVNRVFVVTDASRFSTMSADTSELLSLQPELNRVLAQLEAKL